MSTVDYIVLVLVIVVVAEVVGSRIRRRRNPPEPALTATLKRIEETLKNEPRSALNITDQIVYAVHELDKWVHDLGFGGYFMFAGKVDIWASVLVGFEKLHQPKARDLLKEVFEYNIHFVDAARTRVEAKLTAIAFPDTEEGREQRENKKLELFAEEFGDPDMQAKLDDYKARYLALKLNVPRLLNKYVKRVGGK